MVKPKKSKKDNLRECPECGFPTIYGMPEGRGPCCYD